MSVLATVLSYFRRLLVVDGTARIDSYTSDAGERVEEADVLGLSAAWACVNLLAGTIGSLPLAVFRRDNAGNRVVAKDHPLYRLLHDSPNSEQTALDFWEGAQASLELKGNAVALKRHSVSGDVVSLIPLAWDYLTVRRNDSGALVYEYDGDKFSADDVLHVRGFGGSPLGGLSTLAFGANTFGLARAIDKAAGRTFRNGIRASGAFITDKPLNYEQMEEAQARITEKYAGAMQAGRPLLLNNGMKWEQITINPDDAQMLESRAFSVEDICRMFQVPPFMIGHNEKTTSWGTGLEQQILAFQKFILRRRCARIEQACEKQLLSAKDKATGVSIEFNMEGLLRGDSKSRAEFYGKMTSIGAMTINEVRALENLPPVEGGDLPRMQIQNVPITADPAEESAAASDLAALPAR